MHQYRILITSAAGPAGVNFIRSLKHAEQNIFILGVDTNPLHLPWISNPEDPSSQVDIARVVPRCDNKKYLPTLNRLIKTYQISLVYAQSDTEVGFLSENRKKLKAPVILPSPRTVRICQDKMLSGKIWHSSGLPIAKTIKITNDKSIDLAEKEFGYPYWLRSSRGAGGQGSTRVDNKLTATSWLQYWQARQVDWTFIAQEFLPGPIIAFQSVWNRGQLITSQARERIEYLYPYLAPSGITGTPVIARTIHNDKVNKMATRAIQAIDKKATGAFCVDLRLNQNNIPIPTEINVGRFFTTSFFFTKAGINMPLLLIKIGHKERIPAQRKYNAVPADLYWCRHIDCPWTLRKKSELAIS